MTVKCFREKTPSEMFDRVVNTPTAQKRKVFIKDFFSKCDLIRTADLVTFTEEIFNGELHFFVQLPLESTLSKELSLQPTTF